MGKIYKVTNNINKKIYIGQTIQDENIRWNHHIREALNGSNTKFHRALRKYGKDGFIWEVIEEVDNDKLNEREIYWISYYNSYKQGYNSTTGGDLPPRNDIKIICLETNIVYSSCAEAGRQTNINKAHIAECVRGEKSRVSAGGYHWMSLEDYNKFGPIFKQTENELNSKSVKCIETGIVYNSILEASKATGVSRQTIHRCCEGITKNPKKYHWRYNDNK